MENFLKNRTKIDKDNLPQKAETTVQKISLDKPILIEEPKQDEPKVEVISQDGVVKKILITCTCGQKIELQCNY